MIENLFFLKPKVECLIWKLEVENEETKYLVKWQNTSYHRVSWHTRAELKEKGFEVTSSALKTLANRMKKTRELKLEGEHYFNPNYLVADRILNST